MEATPRTQLENNWTTYSRSIEVNPPYWTVFASLVRGNTYVTIIAKDIKKNKSLVSRQLRTLEKVGIITAIGHAVKQSYIVNWETITYFWIWSTQSTPDIVSNLKDWALAPDNLPDWQARFYLTLKERQLLKNLNQIPLILEPVIPQLSQIVRPVVETLSHDNRIVMFFDAFQQVSLSLAIALEEPDLTITKVDIPANKSILQALLNPSVRAWLKYQALTSPGANIARNHLLKLCGLLNS